MSFRVYIAAPYQSGRDLRTRLLGRLAAIGVDCVSSWLHQATGAPEDLSSLSAADVRRITETNDRDLRSADVVLLVDPDGRGRETYCELARALLWGKPIVWCGRRSLSAYRPGVIVVDDLDEAIDTLRLMRITAELSSEMLADFGSGQ